MKKVTLASLALFLLTGCFMTLIPLKGNYEKGPYIITTQKSFDQVWDKLIDLFAQGGIPIKIIDRSSGLLISEATRFTSTIELNDGTLEYPNASIVIPKYYDKGSRKYYPITYFQEIRAEWNVRVKKTDNGTSINVNILNAKYYNIEKKTFMDFGQSNFNSTGVFEKFIANAIK